MQSLEIEYRMPLAQSIGRAILYRFQLCQQAPEFAVGAVHARTYATASVQSSSQEQGIRQLAHDTVVASLQSV